MGTKIRGVGVRRSGVRSAGSEVEAALAASDMDRNLKQRQWIITAADRGVCVGGVRLWESNLGYFWAAERREFQ